jgi:hypothetical protein
VTKIVKVEELARRREFPLKALMEEDWDNVRWIIK